MQKVSRRQIFQIYDMIIQLNTEYKAIKTYQSDKAKHKKK